MGAKNSVTALKSVLGIGLFRILHKTDPSADFTLSSFNFDESIYLERATYPQVERCSNPLLIKS